MRFNVRKMSSPKIDRRKPNMTDYIKAKVTTNKLFIYRVTVTVTVTA